MIGGRERVSAGIDFERNRQRRRAIESRGGGWSNSRDGAAGVQPSPVPHADFVTRREQGCGGLARPGTRPRALRKRLDARFFSGIQGGPLMHIVAARRCAKGSDGSSSAVSGQIVANAQRLAA